jgi:hypothetical protein
MKCKETQGKWCKNKHGASKIIDTFETYNFHKVVHFFVHGAEIWVEMLNFCPLPPEILIT